MEEMMGMYSDEQMTELEKCMIKKDNRISDLKLVDYNNYQLPFTPYAFQIEDAEKIIKNKRVLMGHDMGCGKTFIAVLVGTSIDVPKLVICPESLRLNWRKEIKNITPNADIKVLYSNDIFCTGKDWTIIGYGTVDKYKEELLAQNIKCVFIDEAHYCKAVNNCGKPASKRAGAVLELSDNAEYVYAMTGTPMPTRNKDLYNIFRILDAPEIIKGERWDFFNYGKEYCDGYNNGFGWNFNGSSNSEKLSEILNSYMVRRLKKEVLPNQRKQRIFIPIETHSKEYFVVQSRIKDPDIDSDTFLGLAMTGRRLLSKDKVLASIDLANTILESNNSVVIVSEFTETINKIEKTYGDKCCVICGGMTDKEKQQSIDAFQSGKKKVCALNMIAGGVGITLTQAHDMIICDYDWTPSNMSQVEDRICRSGQSEYCNIHYIYCENTLLDKTFMEMITNKSSNIDHVIDNAKNTMNFKDKGDNRGYIQRLKDKCKQEKSKKEDYKSR